MKTNLSREQIVQLSSLYYRCEKYDDMITCAKRLISENPDLTAMERNVFVEGYKFKLDKQRKSLIKLISIEQKEIKRGSSHVHFIKEIKTPAIEALIQTTKDFDEQIDILLEKSKNFNDMVFYNRLKCDFLRYRCQFLPKTKRESEVKLFMDVCDKAEKLVQQYLSVTNIRYMELMLSKCVFLYEILKHITPKLGCEFDFINEIIISFPTGLTSSTLEILFKIGGSLSSPRTTISDSEISVIAQSAVTSYKLIGNDFP